MAEPQTRPEDEEYNGETDPPGWWPRLGKTGVTLVIGGNFNPVGHAMFRMGEEAGWIHVHRPIGKPEIVPSRAEFLRYLRTNRKTVYRDIDIPLPYPQGALDKIVELRRKNWLWLGVPHNCVAFCEEIINAGGADWGSVTNLPFLISFLGPWINEDPPTSFQASVQIEGPSKLSLGKSGVYRARVIGLPGGGQFQFWPKVGQELDGLRSIQSSQDQVTLSSTRPSGKAAVFAKYRVGDTTWAGRLEIALER